MNRKDRDRFQKERFIINKKDAECKVAIPKISEAGTVWSINKEKKMY